MWRREERDEDVEFMILGVFTLRVFNEGVYQRATLSGERLLSGWDGDRKSAKKEALRLARRELVTALYQHEVFSSRL